MTSASGTGDSPARSRKHPPWAGLALGTLLVLGVVLVRGWISGEGGEEAPAPLSSDHGRDLAPAYGVGLAATLDRFPELGSSADDDETRDLRRQIVALLERHEFRKVEDLASKFPARGSFPDLWAAGALADALVELGKIERAEEVVQRMLDAKPCGPVYFRAAYLLHLRGDAPRAEATLRLAFDAFDRRDKWSRVRALAELGDLLWFRGDLAGASQEYDRALVLAERPYAGALAGLGRVAAARGDLDLATRLLEEASSLSPSHLPDLASLYQEAGRTADISRLAQRARNLADRDPTWSRVAATLFADQALDVDLAVRLARSEVESRPNVHSWDALVWALVAAGRVDEACEAAQRSTILGTREPLLLFHAGMAAWRASRKERCVEWLRAALEANPAFHVSHSRTAREILDAAK